MALLTILVAAEVRRTFSNPEPWLPTADGDFPGTWPNRDNALLAIFSIFLLDLAHKLGSLSSQG